MDTCPPYYFKIEKFGRTSSRDDVAIIAYGCFPYARGLRQALHFQQTVHNTPAISAKRFTRRLPFSPNGSHDVCQFRQTVRKHGVVRGGISPKRLATMASRRVPFLANGSQSYGHVYRPFPENGSQRWRPTFRRLPETVWQPRRYLACPCIVSVSGRHRPAIRAVMIPARCTSFLMCKVWRSTNCGSLISS